MNYFIQKLTVNLRQIVLRCYSLSFKALENPLAVGFKRYFLVHFVHNLTIFTSAVLVQEDNFDSWTAVSILSEFFLLLFWLNIFSSPFSSSQQVLDTTTYHVSRKEDKQQHSWCDLTRECGSIATLPARCTIFDVIYFGWFCCHWISKKSIFYFLNDTVHGLSTDLI